MDQYASSPGHTNYTVTQNTCILYQLPPLLLAIFWILWWEDNRGICTDNPSGRQPVRTMGALTSSVIPPLPLLPQPSQFTPAWDRHRIMLACMPSGLVTQWLGHPQRKWICEAHAETTCRLVNILNVSRKGDSSDAALPTSTVATWLYFSKDKTSPS